MHTKISHSMYKVFRTRSCAQQYDLMAEQHEKVNPWEKVKKKKSYLTTQDYRAHSDNDQIDTEFHELPEAAAAAASSSFSFAAK